MTLRLDWCSHESALYACSHWHYSGSVPNQKTVKVGVWEDGHFVGCILFGDGANKNLGRPYGVHSTVVCELVRVALTRHVAQTTRIIRVAITFLRRRCPGIRLIVSFADPERGHIGAIYQAGNWIYAGRTEPADEYLVNGIRMHGRALRSTRSTHRRGGVPAANVEEWARIVLRATVIKIEGSSKYRYLLPLDRAMRSQVLRFGRPYPTRVRSAENGTAVPTAGGGVIPTRTLQTGQKAVKVGEAVRA